jgi:formate-dependent nitrite reductase membrane component NrfD
VALGAVAPAPLLLIADLGRPDRFLNMLRVFKPRSPMNMGAWCLVAFSSTAAGAVGADILGRPQLARALGLSTAALGGYLGSYTGVLLACTAVPAWARSRILLGPIFISTATATGAAATRLALAAEGLPDGRPTARALRTIETGSMLTELSLSAINERLLGQAAEALRERTPGLLFRAAKSLVLLGMSTRIFARRGRPWAHDLASVLYLAAGLAFRFAWVFGGRASAEHDEAVAAMARGRQAPDEETERPRERRAASVSRSPLPLPSARRAWGEGVRRASLAVGRLVRS